MPQLPTVTALVTVHNYERFVAEAIKSALAQDYPPELLDVVVVDDGSSDSSAAVADACAAESGGRVRVVSQANRGNAGAINRAIAEAGGEMLAMLDADDAWPADKIRRQVEVMLSRPDVGYVYTDMRVIDTEGEVLQESWLAGDVPPEGRCFGALLPGNPCTASSVMIRAEVAARIGPIPEEIPFADWWLAMRTAQQCEIAYLALPRTLYRFHGENMSLGTQGAIRARELRRSMSMQRWFLRRLAPGEATPAELREAWTAFEREAREALELLGSPFVALLDVTAAERAQSRALAQEGRAQLARGEVDDALVVLARAAAIDPWHELARDGLLAALAAALPSDDSSPAQDPLRGARPFVVLAYAEELLEAPALLTTYVDGMRDAANVTLAIDASAMEPAAAAERLGELADTAGLGDDIDVLALVGALDEVGRARLAAGVRAIYTELPAGDLPAPRFAAGALGDLRSLAAAA